MKIKNKTLLVVSTLVFLVVGISCSLLYSGNKDNLDAFWPPRTRRPTPTRVTRTPTPLPTFTYTPTSTFTVTPLPTATDTPIPTETSTPDGNIITLPISAVPVTGIPDRLAVSAQLLGSDIILIRSTSAQMFTDFPYQTERSMMFTILQDGYPDNVPASISAILALADQYGVTTLSYNLEWPQHTLQEKVDRLATIRAELDAQGNTRPLIFGPIFNDFWVNYAVFAPYIDGYAVQLQRAEIGTEASLAMQSIQKANSVLENPIMYFQISAQATGEFARTVEQVITAVQEMSAIDGVSFINLYFTDWWLPEQVLATIRPIQ